MSDILLLAIGNTLLRDDGAGRHVLEFLKHAKTLPQEVSCLDGCTLSFALAANIERCWMPPDSAHRRARCVVFKAR